MDCTRYTDSTRREYHRGVITGSNTRTTFCVAPQIAADAAYEELYAGARKAHEAGWQIGTHANGDAAIDMMLRIYERLQREMPRRDPRYRLEHCTVVNPSLIGRIRALARKAPMHVDGVSINDVVQEVIALTGAEMDRSRVVLRTQLAGNLPPISCVRFG